MASIEAGRALAALAVLLMHAANYMRMENFSGHVGLANVFDFGYVGVDYFFVLSGFIICYVHFADLGQPARLPVYLWRRFSRIYPIYWIMLALVIAATSLVRAATGKDPGLDMTAADIPGTLLLVLGSPEPKYIGVAWSLQFEVFFYLVFCLMIWRKRAGAVCFGLWGGLVAGQTFGWWQLPAAGMALSAHCLEFLFGVGTAWAARTWRLRAFRFQLPVALLVLIAATVFEVYGPLGRHSAGGRVVMGLASAGVLWTLVSLENGRAIRTPGWLAKMGAVSYSIYLGHSLFINITYSALLKAGLYHRLPELAVFAMAVAVSLAATMAIGWRIEMPLVRLLKQRH